MKDLLKLKCTYPKMCTIANPQPFSAHGYYNKIYSIFMEKIQEKKSIHTIQRLREKVLAILNFINTKHQYLPDR